MCVTVEVGVGWKTLKSTHMKKIKHTQLRASLQIETHAKQKKTHTGTWQPGAAGWSGLGQGTRPCARFTVTATQRIQGVFVLSRIGVDWYCCGSDVPSLLWKRKAAPNSWVHDQGKSLFSQGGSEDSEEGGEGGCLTRFSVVTAFEVHAPILTASHCNKLHGQGHRH